MSMTVKKTMEVKATFGIIGVDPGPENTAAVRVLLVPQDGQYYVNQIEAVYFPNTKMSESLYPWLAHSINPQFLAVEICGTQFKTVGESVFETAAMGGAVRYYAGLSTNGTYCLRSSEWRHALTGAGNSRSPVVYEELKRFFVPSGGGSDPYKGIRAMPGPLWAFHEAGKGGNVEHLKDALGVALGLTMVEFRSGKSPELFRREW